MAGQEGPALQREFLLFYLNRELFYLSVLTEWKQMVSCDVHLTFADFFPHFVMIFFSFSFLYFAVCQMDLSLLPGLSAVWVIAPAQVDTYVGGKCYSTQNVFIYGS